MDDSPALPPGADGRLGAICLPRELFPVASRGRLMSGIDKLPVDGPVEVREHGIWGDVQGDREHHGGLFKAVYAYSREAREALAAAEGRDFPDGFFGENLVTTGIDTDGAVIGEQWRIGSAVLEVTCQRTPCATLSERVGDPRFGRRFTVHAAPGAYLRVAEEGTLAAGDTIDVVHRPDHGVRIRDAFRGVTAEEATRLLDWALSSGTVLYRSLADAALRALDREGRTHDLPAHLMSDGRGR